MRPIHDIAQDMIHRWHDNRAKKHADKIVDRWRETVYFGAVPYLEAMLTMRGQEGYGADSTDYIILYGLSNMSTFRGPEAKALKAELRGHLTENGAGGAVVAVRYDGFDR